MQYPKQVMETEFDRYKEQISRFALTQIGASYDTYEEVGYDWRMKRRYDANVAENLILQTRVFVRQMDKKNLWSSDPDFLAELTNWMCRFLAVYTMRANPRADEIRHMRDKPSRDEYNAIQKEAKKALRGPLYDDFEYIKQLRNKFPKMVIASKHPNGRTARKLRRAENTQNSANEYKKVRGVRNLILNETKRLHKR